MSEENKSSFEAETKKATKGTGLFNTVVGRTGLIAKKAALKAGTSTHSPRRSLATTMHSKGIGLKTIASFTGHTSTDQLCRYVDVGLKEKIKALEALT